MYILDLLRRNLRASVGRSNRLPLRWACRPTALPHPHKRLAEMFLDGGEEVLGLGSTLVVIRLIDPTNHACCIDKDRRRHGQSRAAGRSRVNRLVRQPIKVRDLELPIREHRGLQLVLATPRPDLLWGIRADGHDLDPAPVEFGPKFLPSP
jgi:hypothetical protein